MALRFRKSFKIAPGVRLNVSKSGLGVSAGVRGARVGIGTRGAYTSVGIPGTGISSLTYASSKKTDPKNSFEQVRDNPHVISVVPETKTNSGVLWIVICNLFVFIVNPGIGLVALLLSVLFYFFYLKKQPTFQGKMALKKAMADYNSGQYADAVNNFLSAYSVFSSDKVIAMFISSSFSQTGDYQQAIKYGEEYLVAHPENIKMQKGIARWYEHTDNPDKALEIIQRLSVDDTDDPETLLFLSRLLTNKGLDDAAIEVLRRAPLAKRTLTPELVDVIYQLGLLYEKTGDRKRARSSFERVYAYDATYEDVAKRVGQQEANTPLPS